MQMNNIKWTVLTLEIYSL